MRRDFWRKARSAWRRDCRSRRICSRPITARSIGRRRCRCKAALLGALAYFVLPIDFIPDMLPFIGLHRRCRGAGRARIKLVSSHITPDHREAAQRTLARMRGERADPEKLAWT